MAYVVWTTFSLILWVVLWSLGAKGWDAAMLSVAILLTVAMVQIAKRFMRGGNPA